jgi:hypothetical protein
MQGPAGTQGPPGPAGPGGVSNATFFFGGPVGVGPTLTKVASKVLPPGNWVLLASAQLTGSSPDSTNTVGFSTCELEDSSGNNIGRVSGAMANENVSQFIGTLTLSLNGGTTIPAGGAEVSLWCSVQYLATADLDFAQILAMQVGAFI